MSQVIGIQVCQYCEEVTAIQTSGKETDDFTITFTKCDFCNTFMAHFKKRHRPYWCTPPPLSSERNVQARITYSTAPKGKVTP